MSEYIFFKEDKITSCVESDDEFDDIIIKCIPNANKRKTKRERRKEMMKKTTSLELNRDKKRKQQIKQLNNVRAIEKSLFKKQKQCDDIKKQKMINKLNKRLEQEKQKL
ncbi:hypothetical protein HZS_6617 [Henneguya salminicola]|nr:hypothetical protein HZS_6617 [Henneguya salminicola]